MPRFYILIFLIYITSLSKAQERKYNPFKVDISVGYALPSGSGSKTGALFAIEPKYAVIDQVAIGLRFEGAAVGRVVSANSDVQVNVIGSSTLTGDYYFNTSNANRLLAGLGVGIYSFAAMEAPSNSNTNNINQIGSYNKVGIVPRIGIEIGHFRTALEYNIISSETLVNYREIKNSYFSIKIGAIIGGAKR